MSRPDEPLQMDAREERSSEAGGIAGLCFVVMAFLAMLALVFSGLLHLFGLLRTYGPIWREMIHATVTPQFAAGMFFGIGLVLIGALIFAYGDRRA